VDAEEELERLRTVYLDRLKRRGSLAEGSRRMGEDEGFLAGQKEHERGMRSLDVLLSLHQLGVVTPEEYYHEVHFSGPENPAGILLYSREFQEMKPDALLVELAPNLVKLATAGATGADQEWSSTKESLRDLDRLRRRDHHAACSELRRYLNQMIGDLAGPRRPNQAFEDLCSALGILAAIYRLSGRRDDAVDLLALTWPLVVQASAPGATAAWYQKAAYVLIDLDRHKRAEEFIQKAHFYYDVAGSTTDRLRTLVDYGHLLIQTKRPAEAIALLKSIEPSMANADHESQFSFHQIMACSYSDLGDYSTTHAHLERAVEMAGDETMARAYCLSTKVCVQFEVGDIEGGFITYREFLELFAKVTGSAQLTERALDYAARLTNADSWTKLEELRALGRKLRGWIESLKGTHTARAAVENFQALIEFERLDEATVTAIREQIRKKPRRRRDSSVENIARTIESQFIRSQ